ncbi:MAG: Gfo/Idh/MocA family oxidoreductase [Gemmatimonadota bacterium]|nr:Gfo/Idh/MocA family oxidoreductase [Gemmatimonadota bacterium]
MSKIRLGIIGCGWVAPFHVQALNSLSDRVEIVWAADPDRMKAEQVSHQIKGSRSVRALVDYQEGLDGVDAVSVLTPHHLHNPMTVDALNAGCHVLLEKPFALSLKEADGMIDAASAAEKVLMVGYPHRYRKSTKMFKELVTGGRYGKLFMIDAMMDEDQREYVGGWLTKKSTLGGGVFFSASPHMLDVMMYIAGDIQTISMVGTHGGLAMEGEDTALSVMKFNNGVVGATRHTWFSAKPGNWYTLRAFCENATLTLTVNPLGDLASQGHLCPWETRITVAGSCSGVLLESEEGLDFTEEVRHFLDCITELVPCQTDGHTARKLMAAVLEAYEKAERDGGLP